MGVAGIRGKIGWVAGGLALAGAAWGTLDYARWRSLGPGGLPANIRGWLSMTRLRLGAVDAFDLSPIRASARDDWRGWRTLTQREGVRPQVSPYPVPHRQLDQLPEEPVRAALRQHFDLAVAENASRVEYGLSCFEKRHPAIRCRKTGRVAGPPSSGEIAHIHPSDHSMHMVLSSADAVAAIESGWGERHRLAGVALQLPVNYVLIYAPRDKEDLAVVSQLLDAAIQYALRVPA